jgi:hypothetical protein
MSSRLTPTPARHAVPSLEMVFADLTQPKDEDHSVVKDGKGTTILVGSVVRVISDQCRAFQVNQKFRGAYDATTKEFVPNDASKFLALPVGMRGVVTKVYNIDVVSANFPIRVKFTRGSNVEEGFDPPTDFVMHFELHEVEVC